MKSSKTKAFEKPEILEISRNVLHRGPTCDHCLGRQLAHVSTGMTNEERGVILRKSLKVGKKSGKCIVCNNIFKKLDKYADDAAKRLRKLEFDTFLVGTRMSSDMISREESLWEDVGIEYCEPIKSELNRELGKLIYARIKKEVDELNPDVVVLLNLVKDRIDLQVNSVFIFGYYKKLVRGIPQTKWDRYEETVEDIIARPVMRLTRGTEHAMHACVSLDTEVLIEDGHSTQIIMLENAWKNKKIISYDCNNKRLHSSKIIDYIKLNSKKMNLKAFKIITNETARKIIATEDHKFYTPTGMVPVNKLKQNHEVAVYPSQSVKKEQREPEKNDIILKESDIRKTIEKYYPRYTKKEKVITELKKKGLLPLFINNDKLLILARILAFLFGDGHVRYIRNRDVSLEFHGKKEDLEKIKKDLDFLGISYSTIRTQKSYSKVMDYYDKERIISGEGKRFVSYSRDLWFLIVALGAPVGDKIIKDISIPYWIKNNGDKFKREFLATLFGCEMDKPRLDKRKYNKKSFNMPRFSINKAENNLQNGLQFINAIKTMLDKFEIKTQEPRLIPYTTRKDGNKTIKICLDFSNKFENLLSLYTKIGFRYCKEREIFSRYVIEYFSMKKFLVDTRKKLFRKALKLKEKGLTLSEIHKKLDKRFVKRKNLFLWIHKKIKPENIKVPNDFPDFDVWLKDAKKSLNDGLVWETIKTIKMINNVNYVYDITTNPAHTFFANGFLVSNCGREDIDARCLDWRPFVLEIKNPVKRKIDLHKIKKEVKKSKKVEVSKLKFSDKKEVAKVKALRNDKTYAVVVEFAKPVKDLERVEKIKGCISQRTPTRVAHRRADKVRKRWVKEIKWKKINNKKVEFQIKGEAGLYIKELVTGDDGRTKPSISALFNNTAVVKTLDVIKIWK